MTPMPRVDRKGVWPGSTPKYPSDPGAWTWSTSSRMSSPSGVTTSRMSLAGRGIVLLRQGLGLLQHVLDGPGHEEGLLGQLVQLAADDHLEAADAVLEAHIFARDARELLGHVEG